MDKSINKSSFAGHFADLFDKIEFGGEPDSIIDLRKNAMNCFKNSGLPTPKIEEWKYTKLFFLDNFKFEVSPSVNVLSEAINQLKCSDEINFIVVINGKYSKEYSDFADENIEFISLADAIKANRTDFLDNYGKSFDACNDSFVSLNSAFANDGVCIKIKKNRIASKAIHILNVFDGSNSDTAVFPRNLIILEENSQAKIIETYHKIGDNTTFSAEVTESVLASDAILDYCRIQILPENHIFVGKSFVLQDKNSVFNDTTFTLEGKFIRNNIYAKHIGEYAETNYFGFYFADKTNYIDNHTFVDHSLPNCNSNEIYKGIISDSATAVFNGKILVRQDAQKTNAYQSNKNILLSDNATINTKPELEIYADDVKCSHGATTGSLDKDHLFYLQARGIPYENARNLLLAAFGEEIIDKIGIDSVKTRLSDIFEKKLAEKLK